jgi:hypothetical protein
MHVLKRSRQKRPARAIVAVVNVREAMANPMLERGWL